MPEAPRPVVGSDMTLHVLPEFFEVVRLHGLAHAEGAVGSKRPIDAVASE